MLFNSFEFLIFFILILSLYWLMPHAAQNRLLLISSYVFYGWWDWRFLILIGISTVVDFFVALKLGDWSDDQHRRRLLIISLIANLGILGFFKYFNFFADSAVSAFGAIGFHLDPITLNIILPVGISFYTFQTLSYTIDVYRRELPPSRNLLDFALFVSFFPQLVAGPIERATHLLPQVQRERTISAERVQSGLGLIVVGLLRKVVIADVLAPTVDRIFGAANQSSWEALIVATLAFGLQIYGDFAGYSSMARGIARLLGFELIHNFRQPYLSRSITEFWRRWHISLSRWLRDYLYVPLGGNRKGPTRTYVNLTLVMLLGGLWHGAAWTFVVWGGFHGLLLAAHRFLTKGASNDAWTPLKVWQLPSLIITFVLVHIGWIFFRAPSLDAAFSILKRIVSMQTGFFDILDAVTVIVLMGISLLLDLSERAIAAVPFTPRNSFAVGLGMGVGLAAVLVASGSEVVPFIYFQF